ncbi:HlyD family secretion protein [Glaciecola sp. MH2013]|uniref:HlyD family secretion protein n=1 Tax=Glaciecola sp. MH2013 TaxID=2785524 RepID=UPI00189E4BF5|nr:HlyD family efflux transporter periplasmic adaptor subunit [Glaciecola sp. MH2013]
MGRAFAFVILFICSFKALTNELLLTGQISSSAKQVVNAPQSSRWQIQIQWMEEEGKIVSEGDVIAVFDGSNEQSRLDQNQESLERQVLELEQLKMEQERKLSEAQGSLKLALMRVKKAQIEASVPATEVSRYDKGQYDLALQRALLEQVKAEEALRRAEKERSTELEKKRIDIQKVEEEINYLNSLLNRMNVTATLSGPITYGIHPWTQKKIAAGTNLQPSWKVLDVQASSNFQIETWIHEIDAVGLEAGVEVELVIDAFPDKRFIGLFDSISSQSEKRSQWSDSAYFPSIIQFKDAPDVNLAPGMSVRIHVNAGDKNDA